MGQLTVLNALIAKSLTTNPDECKDVEYKLKILEMAGIPKGMKI